MNILIVSNDPNLFIAGSGVQTRMREYADALQGGMLHILAKAARPDEITNGPLRIHGIAAGKLGAPFVLARVAHRLISQENIAVVSAQDPFEHGWAALRAVRGTPAKLHIQVHTDFLTPWFTRGHIYRSPKVRMPLLNGLRRHIARYVLPRAHSIRCVSQRVKDSLMQEFGSRIPEPSVIPIHVDAAVPPPVPLPQLPFTFALIAVGRLEPEKRVEDVIATVNRLKDAYPSLGAVIVGEGREHAKLERTARRLGLTDRIVFLGARQDARGLMASAQCFIQASAYEGYGLTLVEAALARVPIVTTDVGIVGEVLRGYHEVLAAPVADPTNLAAHVAWLIEDHEARKELALSAETRIKQHLAQTDSSPTAVMADIVSSATKAQPLVKGSQ